MTEPSDVDPSAHLSLLSLFARLLATEIDLTLYRRLRAIPRDREPFLISPDIAKLTDEDAVIELATEYCRLFIGPRPACPPYPTTHQGGSALSGAADRRFAAFLNRHDLHVVVISPESMLSNGHLAVQLTLLRDLVRAATDPTQAPEARHQAAAHAIELNREHLEPALARFAPALVEAAGLAPYTVIGALAPRVVAEATAMTLG